MNHRLFGAVRDFYQPTAHWTGPGARRLFAWGEITGWFTALIGTFSNARVTVDHTASVETLEGQQIAVRWSLAGTHDGSALYGAPSLESIYLLAVTHWCIRGGSIAEEVTVFDEVALLRQMEGGL